LPENMGPQMTSIHPMWPVTSSMWKSKHSKGALPREIGRE